MKVLSTLAIAASASLQSTYQRLLDDITAWAKTNGDEVAIQIGWVSGNETFSVASGQVTDRQSRRPATPDDTFLYGSGTKPVTAAAVMRLVDTGAVGLNDTLAQHVDPLLRRDNGTSMVGLFGSTLAKATVGQVLRMAGGTPDFEDAGADPFDRQVFEGIDGKTSLSIFGQFLQLVSLSMLLGVGSGMLSAVILKFARMDANHALDDEQHRHFNVPELGLYLICAYAPFVVAVAIDLSGIVAVMFAGVTMRHFAHYNLTRVTRGIFLPTVELLASLCETYIFLILGVSVYGLSWTSLDIKFIVVAFFALLIGRAAHVVPGSWMINRMSRSRSLRPNEQLILWFSGIRGSVAFVCALRFPGANRDLILSTTCTMVGVTLVLLGWPTPLVLKYSKVADNPTPEQRQEHERQPTLTEIGRSHWYSKLDKCVKTLVMTPQANKEREQKTQCPDYADWVAATLYNTHNRDTESSQHRDTDHNRSEDPVRSALPAASRGPLLFSEHADVKESALRPSALISGSIMQTGSLGSGQPRVQASAVSTRSHRSLLMP